MLKQSGGPVDRKRMAGDEEFVWAVKAEGHLITNRAGASARDQAGQIRAAEPVRTRVARLLGVRSTERAYRLGAVGEEAVGARLAKLDPSDWLVLHDIVLNEKGTNLDHLVIGPPGVFSLNTKHHPKAKVVVTEKTLRVNGYRQKYFPVALHEAVKVSKTLSAAVGFPVLVHPVIVVMGAELEIRSAPTGISVIRRRDLPKWFVRLSTRVKSDEVKAIMSAAGRPSTWRSPSRLDAGLTVQPWRRYGLKRLYVNDANGNSLGYRDETTGETYAKDPADLGKITAALARR